MTKHELRAHIKAKINLMTAAEHKEASTNICQQIIATDEWQTAKTVFLYASLPDEVDLRLLMHDAIRCGKRVVLPVIDGNNLQIRFYDPMHIVCDNIYSISEPDSLCPTLKDLTEIDLAIIPGRAFTLKGGRMGRGKGYYDRLLPSLRCPLWGVAFASQIFDDIPTDPWDVCLNRIISTTL